MDDIRKYDGFLTERRNPASFRLDCMGSEDIVGLFLEEERAVDAAIKGARSELARGIDMLAGAYGEGRIFMVGAGTSGRLALLEAAECPPTFGTDPGKIIALMAGGDNAVFRAREGAEDDRQAGGDMLAEHRCGADDLVVGIAASGLTPFVQGALQFARSCRARTILVTCNPAKVPPDCAELVIGLPVGPEVLTGSTRLKAGTATKRALNILTTGAMVRNGKVYQNLMVDVQVRSNKLYARAVRIVSTVAGVDHEAAKTLLEGAGGSAKVAIVMALLGISCEDAKARLGQARGVLREVIGDVETAQ